MTMRSSEKDHYAQMIMLLSVLISVMPLNIRYKGLMQSQRIAKCQNIFESLLGCISPCTRKYRVLHKLNIFICIYLKYQLAIPLLLTPFCLYVTLITCDQLVYTYSCQLEMLISQTYSNFNTTFYDLYFVLTVLFRLVSIAVHLIKAKQQRLGEATVSFFSKWQFPIFHEMAQHSQATIL